MHSPFQYLCRSAFTPRTVRPREGEYSSRGILVRGKHSLGSDHPVSINKGNLDPRGTLFMEQTPFRLSRNCGTVISACCALATQVRWFLFVFWRLEGHTCNDITRLQACFVCWSAFANIRHQDSFWQRRKFGVLLPHMSDDVWVEFQYLHAHVWPHDPTIVCLHLHTWHFCQNPFIWLAKTYCIKDRLTCVCTARLSWWNIHAQVFLTSGVGTLAWRTEGWWETHFLDTGREQSKSMSKIKCAGNTFVSCDYVFAQCVSHCICFWPWWMVVGFKL